MTSSQPNQSIRQRKAQLRALAKKGLASMTAQERHEKSVQVCERLMTLPAFRRAQTVMMYMPLPEEVDVTPIALRCFQQGATVCVPRVDWAKNDMSPVEVRCFDDQCMDLDEHGIRVPRDGRVVVPSWIDLVIVPGLAFDDSGHRLGRGAGYYDRFLARLGRQTSLIAVAYDEQIVEQVPVEPSDAAVHTVVTDRRMTRVPKAPVG